MTGLTLQPSILPAPARAPRPALAATPAPRLTPAEQTHIADAFPDRPHVAQRLYGPTRQTLTAPQIGARIDLSA